jgi:hypothetical protein
MNARLKCLRRKEEMQFNIPEPMNLEHEELHHDLSLALEAGGKVGAAAQRVAEALHAHFENEEKFALPPLLASGSG